MRFKSVYRRLGGTSSVSSWGHLSFSIGINCIGHISLACVDDYSINTGHERFLPKKWDVFQDFLRIWDIFAGIYLKIRLIFYASSDVNLLQIIGQLRVGTYSPTPGYPVLDLITASRSLPRNGNSLKSSTLEDDPKEERKRRRLSAGSCGPIL